MAEEVLVCPKCGALISKNLTRCRQCKHYLMGTSFEGFLAKFIPEKYLQNPTTNLLILMSVLPMLLIFLTIGLKAILRIPAFTMLQVGASFSSLILDGQYWRFVTANFVHFNLLHFIMNFVGLLSLGPLIEEMFDFKKSYLIFLISGIFTFIGFYFIEFYMPSMFFGSVSGGASAGLFGLIGAGVAGAKKFDFRALDLRKSLIQLFIQNLIFGIIILPMGSNVLHLLGFASGYVLGGLFPVKTPLPGPGRTLLSISYLLGILVVIISFALQSQDMKRYSMNVPEEHFESHFERCVNGDLSIYQANELKEKAKEAIISCEITLRAYPGARLYVAKRLVEIADLAPDLLNKEKQLKFLTRVENSPLARR